MTIKLIRSKTMKMKKHLTNPIGFRAALWAVGIGLAAIGAQAQHINAGAVSTNQGGQLYFQNGASFVNTSGFVASLNYSNSGTYAGFFNIGGLTFTALARTNAAGPPSPAAAAFGSFLQLRLETVISGPAGGTFSFWEDLAGSPTLSLGVGQTVGTGNLFPLSDASLGAGLPGGDPYGHLHGRRYTATLPGDYLVGFRIVDTSNNGFGGGPIQSDSDLFLMTFRAVPEPATGLLLGAGALALAAARRWRKASR